MGQVSIGRNKVAVFATILLAILSTGIAFLAHSHETQVSSDLSVTHVHNASKSTPVIENLQLTEKVYSEENLMGGACGALFIVVLLLGRKYALRFRKLHGTNTPINYWSNVLKEKSNLKFTYSLTRSQLGIIRI